MTKPALDKSKILLATQNTETYWRIQSLLEELVSESYAVQFPTCFLFPKSGVNQSHSTLVSRGCNTSSLSSNGLAREHSP